MFRPIATAPLLLPGLVFRGLVLLGLVLVVSLVSAQEPKPAAAPAGEIPPSFQIQIPEEPRGIDPANFLPAEVTAKFTVEFDKTPFKDVVKWLSSEAHLNVVVDGSALDLNPLLSTEPVTDRFGWHAL